MSLLMPSCTTEVAVYYYLKNSVFLFGIALYRMSAARYSEARKYTVFSLQPETQITASLIILVNHTILSLLIALATLLILLNWIFHLPRPTRNFPLQHIFSQCFRFFAPHTFQCFIAVYGRQRRMVSVVFWPRLDQFETRSTNEKIAVLHKTYNSQWRDCRFSFLICF